MSRMQHLMRSFIYRKNDTAMEPHVFCSYNGIALFRFDLKTLSYAPKILCWKRLRDYTFAAWNHSPQDLHKFFEFMNSIDISGKIKCIMSIANNDSVLEFLDLGLYINEHIMICLDVYSKPTNMGPAKWRVTVSGELRFMTSHLES